MLLKSMCVLCAVVRGDDSSVDGGEGNAETDSSLYAKRQSMWFGPRLGRNKRTQYDITLGAGNDNSLLPSPHENILDLLRDSNWAIIPVTSGDSSEPSWVSRLGRTEDDEEAMEASRSPPFAPRLGRRRHLVSAQFAPRLGRTYVTTANAGSAHHS
uniref:Pyrokinin n=1 Tax=Nilaparvata lugens TaxID=108931 RepID=U3U905_NILLU|nr:pyrokinin [Nilaparvata lugens]